MVGRSASVEPVSAWRIAAACCAVRLTAASINPSVQAEFRLPNAGMTIPIMTSNPLPSAPSITERGTRTAFAETGEESLPRRPSPSNGPWTEIPAAPDGTSQMVLRPPAASGVDDQTNAVAREAEVTQLLRALRTTSPLSLVAVLTGAQKWLRDPASLNASVLRWSPLAAARRTSTGAWASRTAAPQ